MKKAYPVDRVRSEVAYTGLRKGEKEKLRELSELTGKSESTLLRSMFLHLIENRLYRARKAKERRDAGLPPEPDDDDDEDDD